MGTHNSETVDEPKTKANDSVGDSPEPMLTY